MWFERFLKRLKSKGNLESERNNITSTIIYAKCIREARYVRDISFEKKKFKQKNNLKQYITDFQRLAAFTSSLEQDKYKHLRAELNKALAQELRWVPSHSLDMLIKECIWFQNSTK
jgi:hypothetical protein